jgi:hypothetical protein
MRNITAVGATLAVTLFALTAPADSPQKYFEGDKFQQAYGCDTTWVKEAVVRYLGKNPPQGSVPILTTPQSTWTVGKTFTGETTGTSLANAMVSLPFSSASRTYLDVKRVQGSTKTDVMACRYFRSDKTKDWSDISVSTISRLEQDYVRIPESGTGRVYTTSYGSGTGGFVAGVAPTGIVILIVDPQRDKQKFEVTLHN